MHQSCYSKLLTAGSIAFEGVILQHYSLKLADFHFKYLNFGNLALLIVVVGVCLMLESSSALR